MSHTGQLNWQSWTNILWGGKAFLVRYTWYKMCFAGAARPHKNRPSPCFRYRVAPCDGRVGSFLPLRMPQTSFAPVSIVLLMRQRKRRNRGIRLCDMIIQQHGEIIPFCHRIPASNPLWGSHRCSWTGVLLAQGAGSNQKPESPWCSQDASISSSNTNGYNEDWCLPDLRRDWSAEIKLCQEWAELKKLKHWWALEI